MFLNNILEDFFYPVYSYFIMKYQEYTEEYRNKKNKIHSSFKKIMSYVVLFILLYLFKDFIFSLISKFNKLLQNSI